MPALTELLVAANGGDGQAVKELFHLEYDDMRQLAGRFLAQETAGHTLQPTALVEEAYLTGRRTVAGSSSPRPQRPCGES